MSATTLPCGPLASGFRTLVLHVEPGITVAEKLTELALDAGIAVDRVLGMDVADFAMAVRQERRAR